MLKNLFVQNFALIEREKLVLHPGFTVLTGETGSGKSILLGALRLILGERADFSVIRDTDKKTIVEAEFDLAPDLQKWFETNDLDFFKETIIRREISAKGKSRAFINDTPVSLQVLKELAEHLIHIHSQHHTVELKKSSFQLDFLDLLANTRTLRNDIEKLYQRYTTLERKIKAAEEQKAKHALELDFIHFQLEELEKLNLEKINYTQIEEDFQRFEKIEDIKNSYRSIVDSVTEEQGINNQLTKIIKTSYQGDSKLNILLNRIQEAQIELNDIAEEASDQLADLEMDPLEMENNIALLDAYNAMLKKHQCSSEEELAQIAHELHEKSLTIGGSEEQIEHWKKEAQQHHKELVTLVSKLSNQRQTSAKKIAYQVQELLAELKLPSTTIEFSFERKEITSNGIDLVKILFSPNKGHAPQSIEKAASGGELSRLMLAMHYLLSAHKSLPTVIFDEIDTGVSGDVADRIGQLLKKMGDNMQLLAITHLPQVASKGNYHIKVDKKEAAGVIKTEFANLNREERIEEIAKLMSGTSINEAAILNAKELLAK